MLEITASDAIAADPTMIALIRGVPTDYAGSLASDRKVLCTTGGGCHIIHWCPSPDHCDRMAGNSYLVSFYCPTEELYS